MRAYAQTSGVWVRGVLANEYGVDLDSIIWGTMEDAHLAEYVDPSNTHPLYGAAGAARFDAAGRVRRHHGRAHRRSGRHPPRDTGRGRRAAHDWIRRSGIHPINHILTVKNDVTAANPWLPEELMDMFTRAREIAIADGTEAPPVYGFEKNSASLQLCMQFSADQRITPHVYDVNEMFYRL